MDLPQYHVTVKYFVFNGCEKFIVKVSHLWSVQYCSASSRCSASQTRRPLQTSTRPSHIGNGLNRKAGTPSTKISSGLSFILLN